MSTIYKLGPNQRFTIQLDVDQVACRVRMSVNGHVELDKQVVDRLVFAFRLAPSQKLPLRLVAELSGWRLEAGLFLGSKQVPPVNGQLASVEVPADPDADNQPIGAGTAQAAMPPAPPSPTQEYVPGPDELVPELSEVDAAEQAAAEAAAAAAQASPARVDDEIPVLGGPAGGEPEAMPATPPQPEPGPAFANAPPLTTVLPTSPRRRSRTDLGNPGILACMVMAIVNLIALILTHVTKLVSSPSLPIQSWEVVSFAVSGVLFLVLAFTISLRSVIGAVIATVLTSMHVVLSLTGIIWVAATIVQKGQFGDMAPLILLGSLLLRDVLCLFLLAQGISRLRTWWA
jgi:uncharacterized Tic20 family protein